MTQPADGGDASPSVERSRTATASRPHRGMWRGSAWWGHIAKTSAIALRGTMGK